jgi:cytochrome c-type biogenesis protein CcmH
LIGLLCLPAGHTQAQSLEDTDAAYREVANAIICQCGCNSVLHDCGMHGCGSATPMRAEIRLKLRNGETPEAILASFVDQYGLVVLAAPPASGFNLTAWIMPFVALLGGAFIAKKVLSSWRRESIARSPESSTSPPEVADSMRDRIEKELEELEL